MCEVESEGRRDTEIKEQVAKHKSKKKSFGEVFLKRMKLCRVAAESRGVS